MPPLPYDPRNMPPLSHILRFWTSSAILYIDAEQSLSPFLLPNEEKRPYHSVRVPQTGLAIGKVRLDPEWGGMGKLGEFIYISTGHEPLRWGNYDLDQEWKLNFMLIEWDDKGVVASRVTMCEPISIHDWRLAAPVWKCISLA